jgi:hypothetical protein
MRKVAVRIYDRETTHRFVVWMSAHKIECAFVVHN